MRKRKIFIDGFNLLYAKIEEKGEFKGCLAVEAHDVDSIGRNPEPLNSKITCYFENIYDDEYELVYAVDCSGDIDYIGDELNGIELFTVQGGFGQVVTIKKNEGLYLFDGKNYLVNGAICIYRSKKRVLYFIYNCSGSYIIRNFANMKSIKPTKEIKENVILI